VTVSQGDRDALGITEGDRVDLAKAYLAACAESTGVGKIASFDRTIDRVDTIERTEPTEPPPGS
jgi:predicted nucleic acid-binding protein